jgi:uncharacterized protein (TIGR02757 family)
MKWSVNEKVSDLLNEKYLKYNHTSFIENDPISIPHRFTKPQDIEISGFFAAILAWGQRKTIINKCNELMQRMDNSPFDFIRSVKGSDLKSLEGFKHRTFNDFDLLYTVDFLQKHYLNADSLEEAFLRQNNSSENVKNNLSSFKNYFFESTSEKIRTEKHIPSPQSKSACKRLNMYLRWMVRKDDKGVDFGLWQTLKPSQMVIPCDVHVENVAKNLGLTQRPKADWTMAEEITNLLKILDPNDPSKYDYALFGMGVENYFGVQDLKKTPTLL